MFIALDYVKFDEERECNVFTLFDTCFTEEMTTQFGGPSLANSLNKMSNTLTLYSLIKHYEQKYRNIPPNLAHYYAWAKDLGFNVDADLINQQLTLLGATGLIKNAKLKYFHGTIIYLKKHKLLPLTYLYPYI